MLRKFTAVFALALVVACVSAKEYKGTATKLDSDKKTVTIKVDDKETTITFSDKTEFFRGTDAIPQDFLSKVAKRVNSKGVPNAVIVTDEKDGKEVLKDGNPVATKVTFPGKAKSN
jgi:hypothetical protein